MHIAFLVQSFPGYGGAEEYVKHLASGLVLEHGYKCSIITSNIDRRAAHELPESINVVKLPVLLKVKEYTVWRGLFKKLIEINADVIHANTYGYWHVDALSFLSRFKRDFKIVFTTHGWEGFEVWLLKRMGILPHKGLFKARIWTQLRPFYDFTFGKMELSSADALIALSPRERILFKFMKVSEDKVFEILPGVNEEFFQDIDQEKICNIRNMIGANPLLLAVGRLSITKGHDIAIKALKFLVDDFPMVKLVIVGKDYGCLSYLKDLVNKLKLEKNVCFSGYLDRKNLILLFKAADLLIHTSYAEGISLTVLEALAAGLPVISTPAGGIPYLLRKSGSGQIVSFNNPFEVYSAVKFLLENSNILKRMKDRALEFSRNLSWSRAIKEHIRVYDFVTHR